MMNEDMDTRLAHVESYAYKRGDPVVNGKLIEHQRTQHPEHYAQWVADKTIGDIEDQHYIAHGLLVTDADLLAALAAERQSR